MKRPSLLPSTLLLREAIRAAHRWQTWAGRVAFTVLPLSILLASAWVLNTGLSDPSQMGILGRILFLGVTGSLTLMALLFAPVTAATGIREEITSDAVDLVLLTRLTPGQIANSKVWARILGLLSLTLGAMPILALAAALGGVSPLEVLAATLQIASVVIVSGSLGGVLGLFTRSSLLVSVLSGLFALLVYGLVPGFTALVAGDPHMAARLSLLGWVAGPRPDFWLAPLANAPLPIGLSILGGRLFALRATRQPAKALYRREVWGLKPMLVVLAMGLALSGLAALVLVLRLALHNTAAAPVPQQLYAALVWSIGACGLAVVSWAFLRLAVDIAETSETLLQLGKDRQRREAIRVWRNPVAWWAARSWRSDSGAVQAVWFAAVLLCSQAILWMVPGGLLALGIALVLAALMLAIWLMTKAIARQRDSGSLDLLRLSGLPPSRILNGTLVGVAIPTVPLALLAVPLLLLGAPYLAMVVERSDAVGLSIGRAAVGALWLVPLGVSWVLLSTRLALRWPQRTAFVAATGSLLLVVGTLVTLGLMDIELPGVSPALSLFFGPIDPTAPPVHWLISLVMMMALAAVLYGLTLRDLTGWTALVLAGVLALSLPLTDATADPVTADGLEVRATPFAQGLARTDLATEVHVAITNRGPDTEATLRPEHQRGIGSLTQTETRHRVGLPSGATKHISFRIRAEFIRPETALMVETTDGRELTVPLTFKQVDPKTRTLAILGGDRLGFPPERAVWNGPTPGRAPQKEIAVPNVLRTGLAELDHLPEHASTWSNVDQAVWPQADPSAVRPERLDALLRWVASGGHLTISVTDTWTQVQDSPLSEALPVAFAGTRDWEQPTPLARLLDVDLPSDTVLPIAMTTPSELPPGRAAWSVLERAPGEPLWAIGTYGLGTVTVLSFDTQQPALRPHRDTVWSRALWLPNPSASVVSWREWLQQAKPLAGSGSTDASLLAALKLWSTLESDCLAGQPSANPRDPGERPWPHPGDSSTLLTQLADIAQAQAIPISWLVLFSVAYLVVIGPVDWFILRSIGRRTWTWATFPVWVALFTGASLFGTMRLKGDRSLQNQLEWVDWLPGTQQWRGRTYTALFSAERSTVTLRSTIDDATTEFLADGGYAESPAYLSRTGADGVAWNTGTWTLAYAYTRWYATGKGQLKWEKDGSEWRIRNASGVSFEQVAIVSYAPSDASDAPRIWPLGSLGPGETLRWNQTEPTGRVAPDSDLSWAIQQQADMAEPDGGHFHPATYPFVFIGVSRQPIDAALLEGLAPIRSNLTVVRSPLGPPLHPAPSPLSGDLP